jgi:hypothetical protein
MLWRVPLLLFFGKLMYLIPASIGMICLRLWRWCVRSVLLGRAGSWQPADAVVDSSFELDESSKRFRNLLLNWLFSSWYEAPSGHSHEAKMIDYYDDDHGNDRSKPWVVGLRYSYRADGNMYGGIYLMPIAYANPGSACKTGKRWVGKRIKVRYNPDKVAQSVFLQDDGAPGKPRIPAGWESEPYLTELSLK